MKKHSAAILVALTAAFAVFLLGFYLGRNLSPQPVIVSVPEAMQTLPPETTQATLPPETEEVITFPIDLNTAGEKELTALPGIGQVLAQRILAWRDSHGGFTRVEDVLNVEGIGEKRFEDIIDLITIGG